ncbi:MAG TPA: LysR family transcriptional regulator [Desulfobacteria bacterium]|nr:LysR family transcriptional regulator [Desulfobacteria bacterium]
MLNFNQLRIFYHAARNLNFTAAGRDLFITQPAVTAQIKLLEENCELKLFRKKGRGVYLTDEGQTLFEYTKHVFDYEREIELAIEEMRELKRGALRLGTTKTYARYFMPFLLTRFHQTYSDIRIHLDEGGSQAMVQSLVDFKNEIVIIAKIVSHPGVRFLPLSREEIVAIAHPDHPLAGRSAITAEELARERIIMKEGGSGTRHLIDNLFARANTTPNIVMETSNTEFIKMEVQRGEGIAFLVESAVLLELEQGLLTSLQLHDQTLCLDVSVAYLKDQKLSPPAKAFLDSLSNLSGGDMPALGIGALMAKIRAHRDELIVS